MFFAEYTDISISQSLMFPFSAITVFLNNEIIFSRMTKMVIKDSKT